MSFEIRKLSKSFPSGFRLGPIDLVAAKGTALALLGPNGSGKSVLLRSASLVEPPDCGEISLDDGSDTFNAAAPPQSNRRAWPKLTAVFQEYPLVPWRTVRGNLTLGRSARSGGKVKLDEFALNLLERLQLADLPNGEARRLSGGQQQSLALIAALCRHPDYLLLDEPTSALDRTRIPILIELLNEYKARGGTIICATHHLSFARGVCERYAFLSDGEIAEEGRSEALRENGEGEAVAYYFPSSRARWD